MGEWLTDWSVIDDGKTYIACPINATADGTLYLAQPIGFSRGWQVKRLMVGCYAVLESPKLRLAIVSKEGKK